MKFNRENDRSLHHFYSFLWNEKHPFLFLGQLMFMSILPIMNVLQTNYFICKDQHIYTVLYDSKNNVFAVLDSDEEQIRYATASELYEEVRIADYLFIELNMNIVPFIIQKLDRMESKNSTYKTNCSNIRQVVQSYQSSLKHNEEMDATVIEQRMYNSKIPINSNLIKDLSSPFDAYDKKVSAGQVGTTREEKLQKEKPVVVEKNVEKTKTQMQPREEVPTSTESSAIPSAIPSVTIREPRPRKMQESAPAPSNMFPNDIIRRSTATIPKIVPCDGCPIVGHSKESLQERRAKRNMNTSTTTRNTSETEEDRQKRLDQMNQMIKEKSENKKNVNAKSVSYYRKMRMDQRRDTNG